MPPPRAPHRAPVMAEADWRPWATLLALGTLSAGFVAYAVAPASVLSLVMAEYEVGKPAASASISAVFLTWATLQLPSGLVLDRYDNRRLVAVGAVGFLTASLLGLVVDSYTAFLLTRLGAGACVVFIFVGSITVLGRVLPESRRALGMSLFVASPPIGVALAQLAGPLLAEPYGWRAAVLAYTVLGGVGLAGFAALGGSPVGAPEHLTVREFVRTLRTPSVLLVSIASLCTYAVWAFLVTWMPTYGTEVLGFDLAAAGAAAALVPLGAIVARPTGGWLADRLGGRLVPVIAAGFLASIPLLFALGAAPSPTTFAALLALTGAAVNLGVGLYLVSVDRLASGATRGTSLSVLLTFSQVGNLLAPVAGGWAIARFSWPGAFGFAVGAAVVGLGAIGLAVTVR